MFAFSSATSVQRCNVGGAPARIVDRLAVDGDAHQVQPNGFFGAQLAREACDVDAFVVVEHRELVVDDLHDDVRVLSLREARVHDVRVIARSRDLRARACPARAASAPDRLHRAPRARGGETDIVAVHARRAAIERSFPCSRRSAAARWSCRAMSAIARRSSRV